MKSIHHGTAGANKKMRGKMSATLSCGCCVMFNFKQRERHKEAVREIKNFVTLPNGSTRVVGSIVAILEQDDQSGGSKDL